MNFLAVYDWSDELLLRDIISYSQEAISELFPTSVATNHTYDVIVGSWPKAKRIKLEQLMQLLSSSDEISSVECHAISSTLVNDRSCFFYANKLGSKVLIYGLPCGAQSAKIYRKLEESLSQSAILGYGYEFECDSELGIFNALGITKGYPESEEQEREADLDQLWFSERVIAEGIAGGKRYLHNGMLRDLYEVNLLNSGHLGATLEGNSLLTFIERNAHGTLEKIGSANWRWSITKVEVARLRPLMRNADLLIAPRMD